MTENSVTLTRMPPKSVCFGAFDLLECWLLDEIASAPLLNNCWQSPKAFLVHGIGGSRMIVGIPRETFPGERRVALVAATVPNLTKAGLQGGMEAGAGVEAGYPDADYAAQGPQILADRARVVRKPGLPVPTHCLLPLLPH